MPAFSSNLRTNPSISSSLRQAAAASTWGRMPARRRRKSIRLGVYDHQTREIRIHPALDRPDVLHQLFPSPSGSSRRVHHPRGFRDREKAYPQYQAAIRWEKQNLRTLLRR